jgi:pyruvate/2-oxoglutarate dehydrogenase complex dihydrolipoamide acyltransferase (E2) component
MLNATLLPFLLYQQNLAMAARVALGSLQGATWVARQGTEAGDETRRQGIGPISQAVQGSLETTGRAAPQQNHEITGETVQESGVETTEQTAPEGNEVASGLPDLVPLSPETNTFDGLIHSPDPELLDEPAAEAVDETDKGGRRTSSRADGEGDEAHSGPSAPPVPSSPAREGSVNAGDSPPIREEPLTDETISEGLPAPPEVPGVELPPPPVPHNILDELPPPPAPEAATITDELPPPPTPEVPEDELATPPTRGEKPRVLVRRTTAATRHRAEEMGVDLAEVEGLGKGGWITVDDIRRKALEGQS